MVNFALVREFSVTGIWYKYKDIRNLTCGSPDSKLLNHVDHILIESTQCKNVLWYEKFERKGYCKTKKSQVNEGDKLKKKEGKENLFKEVTASVQGVQK